MATPLATALIVDDESDARENLRDILVHFNYAVDCAANGDEALDRLSERRYDVALIDLRMPGIDGIELTARLRCRQPQAITLLVTAFAAADCEDRAKAAGAWTVINKPIRPDRLLSLLDDAIHGRGPCVN